jgi:hypothetical protein
MAMDKNKEYSAEDILQNLKNLGTRLETLDAKQVKSSMDNLLSFGNIH